MAEAKEENWIFDRHTSLDGMTGVCVEFKDGDELRRYGARFNGEENSEKAVISIMRWVSEAGYDLKGPPQ